ncbi:MAG: hypothetical protein JW782_06200 [Candidatus Saganbacteria bacterium]|nr:hypothetical protein [Candidatus Saganbacteria bacterium]
MDSILASLPLFGIGGSIVPFLSKYAIIRACGSVERSIKKIIYDKAAASTTIETKKYLENTIIESSMNPSLYNIRKLLNKFGDEWSSEFNSRMSSITKKEQDSLQSLVDLRNEFAHGGNPTATASNIREYFEDSIKIVELLDNIISAQ